MPVRTAAAVRATYQARQTGEVPDDVPNDDAELAVAFHNATKYYALNDSAPGDSDQS